LVFEILHPLLAIKIDVFSKTLVINIMAIFNLKVGGLEQKAMIVYILLRVAALLYLWTAYWPTRQQPSS
jgi:hypothetical protein